ncbi:30S ribosomal protein S3 [candidate division WOR-3 bacterium]|nr:30S ribosomal protein S3 [candidate division WOR-3 bacterium]
MGQKTNPIGFRVGITKDWYSRWFDDKNLDKKLWEDITIRRYLSERLKDGWVSRIEIERSSKKLRIIINTARPGIVIGRGGAEAESLIQEIKKIIERDVQIDVQEVKFPELDAKLVAFNIARQIERRTAYRRAMKRAVQNAMRMGAKGIKVQCAGRLGGAEIARREWYREGRVPLHTLRADIDYATDTAVTTAGTIGVKVWVFRGEVQ